MIPAAFGIPLIAMSIMATRQPERSHFWMHIAVVFGLLTFLGGGMGLQGLATGDYSESTIAQLLMLVIGGVYTFACIRSFTHMREKHVKQQIKHERSSVMLLMVNALG